MFNTGPIFAFAAAAQQKGLRVVLVTLYAVTGTSSRNPGAHLAVSEDGSYEGSLSDGCVEGAIVSEALDVLAKGIPRELRLGKGSPFIDVRLPCGGSLDLLFNELPEGLGGEIHAAIAAREPFALSLPRGQGRVALRQGSGQFGLSLTDEGADVSHVPPLRLAVLGHGPTVACLHDLALAAGVEVGVVTQDARLAEMLRARRVEPLLLKGVGSTPDLELDRWTAATLFFHDHDWEPSLLLRVLASDAFFVGAMGSRATHAERCARLAEMGVEPGQIARIVAPIGLIPSLRDPEALAISTLAQVTDVYNRTWLSPSS